MLKFEVSLFIKYIIIFPDFTVEKRISVSYSIPGPRRLDTYLEVKCILALQIYDHPYKINLKLRCTTGVFRMRAFVIKNTWNKPPALSHDFIGFIISWNVHSHCGVFKQFGLSTFRITLATELPALHVMWHDYFLQLYTGCVVKHGLPRAYAQQFEKSLKTTFVNLS